VDEKVAIVTGAARGIGAAIARRMGEDGYRVALVDLDEAKARDVAEGMESEGHPAVSVRADVSRADEVEAAVQAILREWGRVDVLVNCAGIAGEAAPIEEQSPEAWERMIAADLGSVFYFCRAVIPIMKRQRSGRVINIASISGKEGNPNMVPYSAAKAGVIGLTKALAKEVARDGILVHSVAPAVIQTDILDQLTEEQVSYMVERIPMGRPGTPEEVAALVSWLASPECGFSTGSCYDISGGRATY
jgi:NAD(P)-dependent dehydrogenase (short-subunit alcohol dehydrogenase family)